MRTKLFWILWCLLPVGVLAFHYGPGQAWLQRDDARRSIQVALAAEHSLDWAAAADAFREAREALPEEARAERSRLALEEARARVQAGELIEGQTQLEALLADELSQDAPDAALVEELRHELGTTAYWAAWLMRLDGALAEEWLLEAETARQHFRLLAEGTDDPALAETRSKNVEAVIRLEQMDLSELQALPLPKNCPNCSNGLCQKKREQRLSKCKKPGDKDGREKIKTDSAGDAVERGKGS